MKQLISVLITILFISCGDASTEKKQPAPKKDKPTYFIDASVDSMCVDRMLKAAIDTAYTAMQADHFKKEFETMCDSFYNVEVRMTMDHHFSPNEKHLIVHVSIPGECRFNIYLVQDKAFIKVASHSQFSPGGITDTLQDVNGDGANDYLINWYGASGCCLKNFYAVYLYQPQTGTFSKGFEFINPTFSAKEKVIRGVEYGHPGETSMYKYKWNGLVVDTLESVYFEKDDNGKKTGKVIRKTTKEERLKQVPAEYKHIYGYDWFTGKDY